MDTTDLILAWITQWGFYLIIVAIIAGVVWTVLALDRWDKRTRNKKPQRVRPTGIVTSSPSSDDRGRPDPFDALQSASAWKYDNPDKAEKHN